MDGIILLQEARAAGLIVTVVGSALKIRGPRRAEPIAKKLIDHKPEVVNALQAALAASPDLGANAQSSVTASPSGREWDVDTRELIGFFLNAQARLPRTPFRLTRWLYISDPVKWYHSLEVDISFGPLGSRARMGVLQEDLRRLHEFVSSELDA